MRKITKRLARFPAVEFWPGSNQPGGNLCNFPAWPTATRRGEFALKGFANATDHRSTETLRMIADVTARSVAPERLTGPLRSTGIPACRRNRTARSAADPLCPKQPRCARPVEDGRQRCLRYATIGGQKACAYFASFFSLKNKKKITTMTAAKSAGHSQM